MVQKSVTTHVIQLLYLWSDLLTTENEMLTLQISIIIYAGWVVLKLPPGIDPDCLSLQIFSCDTLETFMKAILHILQKFFWRQKQNLSNHNNQIMDCFNLTNFLVISNFWRKMSNFWIFTFPKSLPNGEEGDPRLESEAKFLINCKGDEENGEFLWIFGVWGFGGRFSSLFSIFSRFLSIF